MPQQKDIRVEVKVRNNLILSKMEEKGIASVKELSERMGRPGLYGSIASLVAMKLPARDKHDQWRPSVLHLAEFFQCMPEDIFSEPQQRNRLERNRAHAELAYTELQQLTARNREPVTPEIALQADQLRTALRLALNSLTPREELVLRMRFGLDDGVEKTLDQVGEVLGTHRERPRQIEAKALRKLKHPFRLNKLVAAGGNKKIIKTKSSWSDNEYLDVQYSFDDDVLKAL